MAATTGSGSAVAPGIDFESILATLEQYREYLERIEAEGITAQNALQLYTGLHGAQTGAAGIEDAPTEQITGGFVHYFTSQVNQIQAEIDRLEKERDEKLTEQRYALGEATVSYEYNRQINELKEVQKRLNDALSHADRLEAEFTQPLTEAITAQRVEADRRAAEEAAKNGQTGAGSRVATGEGGTGAGIESATKPPPPPPPTPTIGTYNGLPVYSADSVNGPSNIVGAENGGYIMQITSTGQIHLQPTGGLAGEPGSGGITVTLDALRDNPEILNGIEGPLREQLDELRAKLLEAEAARNTFDVGGGGSATLADNTGIGQSLQNEAAAQYNVFTPGQGVVGVAGANSPAQAAAFAAGDFSGAGSGGGGGGNEKREVGGTVQGLSQQELNQKRNEELGQEKPLVDEAGNPIPTAMTVGQVREELLSQLGIMTINNPGVGDHVASVIKNFDTAFPDVNVNIGDNFNLPDFIQGQLTHQLNLKRAARTTVSRPRRVAF